MPVWLGRSGNLVLLELYLSSWCLLLALTSLNRFVGEPIPNISELFIQDPRGFCIHPMPSPSLKPPCHRPFLRAICLQQHFLS
jgi:hypothetical protein